MCIIVALSLTGTVYDVISGEVARRKAPDGESDDESSVTGGYTNQMFETGNVGSVTRFSNGFSMVTMNSDTHQDKDSEEDTQTVIIKDLESERKRESEFFQLHKIHI